MRHVAEKTQTPIEELYETIGWPLNKKYGHSLDAFKRSITYESPCRSPLDAPPADSFVKQPRRVE